MTLHRGKLLSKQQMFWWEDQLQPSLDLVIFARERHSKCSVDYLHTYNNICLICKRSNYHMVKIVNIILDCSVLTILNTFCSFCLFVCVFVCFLLHCIEK